MQTAGSHELAYASAALGSAILSILLDKSILTNDEAKSVLDHAVEILEPNKNITSVQGAIKILKNTPIY